LQGASALDFKKKHGSSPSLWLKSGDGHVVPVRDVGAITGILENFINNLELLVEKQKGTVFRS